MSATVGVVLTGGASTRMGADKATLVVDGKPMAVRVADALWEAGCQPVECQGGDAASIEAYGLTVHPDRLSGGGPLAAIATALDRHHDDDVVVVACDLVDVDAPAIETLIERGQSDALIDVVAARDEGGRHLLVWWRAGSGTRIASLIDEGVRSYRDALDRLDVCDVAVTSSAIRNVNTPDDLGRRG